MEYDPNAMFMILEVSCLPGAEGKSFEEVRIDDYLQAYRNTGKPPQPCPPMPKGAAERASMGLPRLFEPHRPRLPLPAIQVYTKAGDALGGERIHHISADPSFAGYSAEELRVEAYAKGQKNPPSELKLIPFEIDQKLVKVASSSSSGSTLFPFNNSRSDNNEEEKNEQSTHIIKDGSNTYRHCFEEYRLAWMKNGRDMSSDEIEGKVPPSATMTSPSGSTNFSFKFGGPTSFGGSGVFGNSTNTFGSPSIKF